MLQGDFFSIISTETHPDDPSVPGVRQFTATVKLDPGHAIYDGHFPGNPVVPGVCQVQMVREVAESLLGVRGMLCTASNIKFLNMIVPSANPLLTIRFKIKFPEPGRADLAATISSESTIFLKFNGILCIKPS